jgi:hypothetical protein
MGLLESAMRIHIFGLPRNFEDLCNYDPEVIKLYKKGFNNKNYRVRLIKLIETLNLEVHEKSILRTGNEIISDTDIKLSRSNKARSYIYFIKHIFPGFLIIYDSRPSYFKVLYPLLIKDLFIYILNNFNEVATQIIDERYYEIWNKYRSYLKSQKSLEKSRQITDQERLIQSQKHHIDALEFELKNKKQKKNIKYFQKIEGLNWSEITITFINHDKIKVIAQSKYSHNFNFNEIGFENHKTRNPDKIWELFNLFSIAKAYNNILSFSNTKDIYNETLLRRNISTLRGRLRNFMQIKDDPFYPYNFINPIKPEKGYKPKFSIRTNLEVDKNNNADQNDDIQESYEDFVNKPGGMEIDPRKKIDY